MKLAQTILLFLIGFQLGCQNETSPQDPPDTLPSILLPVISNVELSKQTATTLEITFDLDTGNGRTTLTYELEDQQGSVLVSESQIYSANLDRRQSVALSFEDLTCSESYRITVRASNSAGAATGLRTTLDTSDCPTPPEFIGSELDSKSETSVSIKTTIQTRSGEGELRVSISEDDGATFIETFTTDIDSEVGEIEIIDTFEGLTCATSYTIFVSIGSQGDPLQIVETITVETNDCSPPPPLPEESGDTYIDACRGDTGSEEPCYWRYRYLQSQCTLEKKCSKLILIFSGGTMGCDNPELFRQFDRVLDEFIPNGYVGVCANIFMTLPEADGHTYLSEANRVDLLIKSIVRSSEIQRIWDGEALLFYGISHGATSPVIAMANTSLDDQEEWNGKSLTGACFHDGTYDPIFAANFLSAQPIACRDHRDFVVCSRYFEGDDQTGCPAPILDNPLVLQDLIANQSADQFSVKHWKLVECGSGLSNRCSISMQADVIPAEPIQRLCSNINAGAEHSCDFLSLPEVTHAQCVDNPQAISSCQSWFDNLVETHVPESP